MEEEVEVWWGELVSLRQEQELLKERMLALSQSHMPP